MKNKDMESLGWLMPIYLVFDPANDADLSIVDFANLLNEKIFDYVAADPILDNRLRFRIIEMTEIANSLLPDSRLTSCIHIPDIVESPVTSLKSSFENLKEWITEDVTRWKQSGYQVFRPLVFMFLGRPDYGNDWRIAHGELTDKTLYRFSPNIFCFGTDEVNPSVIYDIASIAGQELRAFAANRMDPGAGLETLVHSVFGYYFKHVLQAPLHAAIATSGLEFPKYFPGISPVTTEEIARPES